MGDPKRRNLNGIGYRMAGVACPCVNQYEYLTSIGVRVLLAAERVGYAERTANRLGSKIPSKPELLIALSSM